MSNVKLDKNLYDVVLETINRNHDTFLDDSKKDFSWFILNHFFTTNDLNDFHKNELHLERYNIFYNKHINHIMMENTDDSNLY